MKRFLQHSIWLILLIVFMVGCGSKNESNVNINADNRKVVTIDLGLCDKSMKQFISMYNNYSDKYYIEITENDGSDYRDILDYRALKIQTGHGADIYVLENDFRTGLYIQRGVLEPLDAFISKDLKEKDYIDNCLEYYKCNNYVYAVPIAVRTNLLLTSKTIAEDKLDFTFDELMRELSSAQINTLFGMSPRDTLWMLYTQFNWDITDGARLELALRKSLEYCDRGDGEKIILGSNPFMIDVGITDALSLVSVMQSFGTIGNELAIVNNPSLHCVSLGINAASNNKEGAWDFIHFLLQDDVQNQISNKYVPVNYKIEQQLVDTMFQMSANNQSLVDTFHRNGISKQVFEENLAYMLQDGRPLELKVGNYEEWRILEEEASAYFNNINEIDLVVYNVLSRVNLLRQEQSK